MCFFWFFIALLTNWTNPLAIFPKKQIGHAEPQRTHFFWLTLHHSYGTHQCGWCGNLWYIRTISCAMSPSQPLPWNGITASNSTKSRSDRIKAASIPLTWNASSRSVGKHWGISDESTGTSRKRTHEEIIRFFFYKKWMVARLPRFTGNEYLLFFTSHDLRFVVRRGCRVFFL